MTATAPQKRRKLPAETWQGLRLAYIAGGGLRQLARAANVSEGTLLARAAREKWSQQRDEAIQRAKGSTGQSDDATARQQQSIAVITRESLMDVHLANMLSVSHRLSHHANALPTDEAFESIRHIDCVDKLTRRQLGLDSKASPIQIGIFGNSWGEWPEPEPSQCEVLPDIAKEYSGANLRTAC